MNCCASAFAWVISPMWPGGEHHTVILLHKMYLLKPVLKLFCFPQICWEIILHHGRTWVQRCYSPFIMCKELNPSKNETSHLLLFKKSLFTHNRVISKLVYICV